MGAIPTPGQKNIPIDDWKRFLRMSDWFERTIEHGKGVLSPTYGQDLIVKTPADGIDARDGDTIYSATCIKCVAVETATPGEKTLHETDEELIVCNYQDGSVSGDAFVNTALSPNGTRYVEGLGSGWEWGLLDGILNAGSSATMSIWRGSPPLTDTGENITVQAPPLLIADSVAQGSFVWALKHRNGLWYVMGAPCG